MALSAAIQEHFANPANIGAMPDADAVGQAGTPGQGPYMTVYLKVDGERILRAQFETYGCPTSRGCGSFLTQWAAGKTLEVALRMEPGDLERILGGLPLGKEHCAALAVEALRRAIGKAPQLAGARQ